MDGIQLTGASFRKDKMELRDQWAMTIFSARCQFSQKSPEQHIIEAYEFADKAIKFSKLGKDKETSKKSHIPTIQEVATYCIQRGNIIDAGKFFDFYEAKGWMIGKNKMKDWKAAVRTWEKNSSGMSKTPKSEVLN